MAFEVLNWASTAPCDSATEKAVLLLLASFAGSDGACYPGQETLAQRACCSVKSVERALKAFEKRGWITRAARRRRDGSRTSDLIVICASPTAEQYENAQPDTVSDRPEPTRHPVQTNPTPCPNQPDTVSGLTTFESPGEPLGEHARAPGTPGLPSDQDVAEFRAVYPDAGLVNASTDTLRLRLGVAAAKHGGVAAVIGAAKRYGAEVAKFGSMPRSASNWLVDDGLIQDNLAAPDTADRTDQQWRDELSLWRDHGQSEPNLWRRRVGGPEPGQPGCKAPAEIQREFDYEPRPFESSTQEAS